jgi:hypothetical protein
MANSLYIRRERPKRRFYRPWMGFFLALVLMAASAAYAFSWHQERSAAGLKDQFQTAMSSQDYQVAIEIYRDVQSRAIQPAEEQDPEGLFQTILNELEAQIDTRLTSIETKLLAGQRLSADERSFAAGMGEVSGLRLSRFIRNLSRDYLVGRLDRLVLQQAISQLKSLENLSANLGAIESQLDGMAEARPAVLEAERLHANQEWLPAYEAWHLLAESTGWGVFVQDYSRQRLEDCRSAMYEPLLSAALNDLDQNRAITAQGKLLEIQPVFPDDPAIAEALDRCKSMIPGKLVPYRGQVEHLVIKPLIALPERAFDGDSYARAAYDTMLTTHEFQAILEQLHVNNYILIDQSRLLVDEGATFSIELPEGKKPLVLVLEGFNYYVSRRATGNCWNLVLDEDNQVSGLYHNSNGEAVVERQAEAIGILDSFVEAHPDFSFDGAKGLITLTGYEGVFGYLTDADQQDDRKLALEMHGYPLDELDSTSLQQNRQAVTKILDRLRQTGWQFGSSTYGFINIPTASLDLVTNDWQKWQAQVGSLTGPVVTLQYPNGAFLKTNDPRYTYYLEQGIRIFGGLGATPYLIRTGGAAYIDKVQLSGYSLSRPDLYQLDRFFDASTVFDHEARNLFRK